MVWLWQVADEVAFIQNDVFAELDVEAIIADLFGDSDNEEVPLRLLAHLLKFTYSGLVVAVH